MKLKLVAAVVMFLGVGQIAFAHRLDQYLQATLITVEDHVQVSMRMIPGVAVSSSVMTSIDINGDGVLSEAEQRTYAERVLEEWSLTIDGKHLRSKLFSASFPEVEQMREGVGEIHLEFTADLPHGGSSRRLIFENQHPNRDEVYLVNCLVSRDPGVQVSAQKRNEQHSINWTICRLADHQTRQYPNRIRALGPVGSVLSPYSRSA